jgi:rhodanese-related sulfurtransferase/transcriptional regulator with XRE-family HTH domain
MVHKIGAREAQDLIAKGELDIVDVREPNEWATGHVPGARLVPLGQLRSDPAKAQIGSRVLFVCERGGRSLHAAELADARGVAEVYSMEGGTSAWREAGLPIEEPAPAPARTNAGPSASASDLEETATPDPELEAVLSENVRAMRAQRGYTLDVLAGLSGVGRHTLGQIELGRATPSLGTLWKMARAFEVPFSALLARPTSTETRIFRASTAKRIVGADGRFSSRALFSPDDKGAFELYELWLAGHGREDAEAHAPGTRENLVVTSGRLVLEIGKERHELAKGDAIAFTADVPHAYVNPGSEECWMNLVMTYVGPRPAGT